LGKFALLRALRLLLVNLTGLAFGVHTPPPPVDGLCYVTARELLESGRPLAFPYATDVLTSPPVMQPTPSNLLLKHLLGCGALDVDLSHDRRTFWASDSKASVFTDFEPPVPYTRFHPLLEACGTGVDKVLALA
jgi:hypothetical protein